MNDVLVVLVLLVIVFIWRGLTSGSNKVATCFQKVIHVFGPVSCFLQWYSLLFIGLGALLARTFYDIVVFEYIKDNFLSTTSMTHVPNFIPGLSDEEKLALEIPPMMKVFSLAAPLAGVVAALVVIEHVCTLVRANAQVLKERGDKCIWSLSNEMNMSILVIAMPMVFILMAMRAEIRIWAVMTGSAWLPFHNGPQPPAKTWEVVKTLELATYTTDLELAGFFQYLTIFSFGRLCVSYLRNAPVQYRCALMWAGLQGVYLYVIFGAFRAAVTFVEAVFSQDPKYQFYGAIIQEKVLTFIGPIFTAATVLCVYNMLIICRMTDVTNKLGNASMKFQATRALVLVSQVQQGILLGVVVGSPLYLQLQNPHVPAAIRAQVAGWSFSPYRAKLMHAALLNFECLIVVLMNRCFWNRNYVGLALRENEPPQNEPPPGLNEPLLNC